MLFHLFVDDGTLQAGHVHEFDLAHAAPVLHRRVAAVGGHGGDARRAECSKEVCRRLHELGKADLYGAYRIFVLHHDVARRHDYDRLEFLGPHHRTDAAAGGEPAMVVADAGNQRHRFAGLADIGHARLLAVPLL